MLSISQSWFFYTSWTLRATLPYRLLLTKLWASPKCFRNEIPPPPATSDDCCQTSSLTYKSYRFVVTFDFLKAPTFSHVTSKLDDNSNSLSLPPVLQEHSSCTCPDPISSQFLITLPSDSLLLLYFAGICFSPWGLFQFCWTCWLLLFTKSHDWAPSGLSPPPYPCSFVINFLPQSSSRGSYQTHRFPLPSQSYHWISHFIWCHLRVSYCSSHLNPWGSSSVPSCLRLHCVSLGVKSKVN